MPTKESQNKSYFDDPQYKRMISAFQKGEWEIAGKLLARLLKAFPGEEKLSSLMREIKIRKQIDSDAKLEAEKLRKKSIGWFILGFVGIAIIVTVSVFAYDNYSVRVQQQVDAINLKRSLASKFEEAQNYLQAGRAAEAQKLFDEIAEIDNEYPQLSESYEQVAFLLELESQYTRASNQSQQGDFSSSLETLNQIYAIDPSFRDVEILINSIELRKNLSVELLAAAGEAYFRGDWPEAISNYEEAAENDPSIVDQQYEERLYSSYIGESENLLVNPNVSQNDVNKAETYFRKAEVIAPEGDENASADLYLITQLIVQNYFGLADSLLDSDADSIDNLEAVISLLGKALLINPDDQLSREQYDLARDYLFGLEKYENGEWEDSIEVSTFAYSEASEYAGGTLRQLLYEAYSSLGWQWFADGESELALEAFQNAESIAQDDPDGRLRLFEAQLNVAMVMGQLEQYREGVSVFQLAVFLSNIKESASPEAVDVINTIFEAEISVFYNDFQGAYEKYQQALADTSVYSDNVEYIIQKGDYLVQIAREFLSTISAIKGNSNLSETGEIFLGQRIFVPVLKE